MIDCLIENYHVLKGSLVLYRQINYLVYLGILGSQAMSLVVDFCWKTFDIFSRSNSMERKKAKMKVPLAGIIQWDPFLGESNNATIWLF